MSECGIVGLFFGCKSPAAATGCSSKTKETTNTIKISGTSLEHALEKSGVDICTTDNATSLSEVGKGRPGTDSLWKNLAKVVFAMPGIKERFEVFNENQKEFAAEKLGGIIAGMFQYEKASIFKSWGPFHYFGCKTRLYGYKTPSQVDLKITTQDVIAVLNRPDFRAIKDGKIKISYEPTVLKSYLNLYNPLSLTARVKAKVTIPSVGIFYAANKAGTIAFPSNCKITVGSNEETNPFNLSRVAPAKSVKVEVPPEKGTVVKETVFFPVLLQTPEGGPFSFATKGTYDIKLACEKPSKFELKVGELEVKKRGRRIKKLPKCKDAYPPAMQTAMRAAGKCR